MQSLSVLLSESQSKSGVANSRQTGDDTDSDSDPDTDRAEFAKPGMEAPSAPQGFTYSGREGIPSSICPSEEPLTLNPSSFLSEEKLKDLARLRSE
jgi:hypothetical protein